MHCQDVIGLCSDYLDGLLPLPEHHLVAAHLGECADCRLVYEDVRRLVQASSTLPIIEPQDRLWKDLQRRLTEEIEPRFLGSRSSLGNRSLSLWRLVRLRPILASLALVGVCVLARSVAWKPDTVAVNGQQSKQPLILDAEPSLPGVDPAHRREERSFRVDKRASVDLSNIGGHIKVTVWARREIRVVTTGSSRKAWASLRQQGDLIQIEGQGSSLDFDISVPENTDLEMRSVRGDMLMIGPAGKVSCRTTSGAIHVEGARGQVSAGTVSGRVEIRDCQGDALQVESVSGRITVSGAQGLFDGRSVSGDIGLTRSRCTGLVVHTKSGGITFEGAIGQGASCSLKSHSGSIEMILPADSSFTVKADTFSGKISTTFSLTGLEGTRTELSARRDLHARHGDGRSSVELKTFSGKISLMKQ